jgi:hypothetical protein
MDQISNLGDRRQIGFCCYCGRSTETRDHVPSKVFLDKPYPSNLPVVFACKACNESFSLDEEYIACLIECAVCGTVEKNNLARKKIRLILQKKPALLARFKEAHKQISDKIIFSVESQRLRKILLKLARGHATYELNEPQLEEPTHLSYSPLCMMNPDERADFEAEPISSIFPEVGSRSSQRLVVNEPGLAIWIRVQPERYRYLTSIDAGINIRMVIREYLACEARWD